MSSRRTRVLVVGGHPVILGVVRLACDALPDVEIVAEATSGSAAIEAASSLTPDLAVVDLDLPGTDGITVLRSLRERGFRGRIVVVSERTDGATVLDAMRLEVDGYLPKPDGLRRIGDAIRRVLEGLALHHVAPMARRVADGEEHGAVLGAGPGEGVFPPRVPVHGVVGVLEEVGAGGSGEPVGATFGHTHQSASLARLPHPRSEPGRRSRW